MLESKNGFAVQGLLSDAKIRLLNSVFGGAR